MKLASLGRYVWLGYSSHQPLTKEITTVSETLDANTNFKSHRPNRDNLMVFSHRKTFKSLIKSIFHIIYPKGTVFKLVAIYTELYVN